jgi:hypothetical protein
MFSEAWRTLVRKYIVYDVPHEMAACFDCHTARCSNDQYETCPTRLATVAAMSAAETAANRAPAECV